jgi:hypothetical protein
MDTRIKIKSLKNEGGSKLSFVKVMKFNSELGLKESKELCEKILSSKNYIDIFITTDVDHFKSELCKTGYIFDVIDRNKERHIKLLSLGLFDKEDKINILSEYLSKDLEIKTRKNNNLPLSTIYFDFFNDLLLNIGEKKIDKLLDNFKNK